MSKEVIPFEDLFFLFARGFNSRGLCRLDLEEAAYLYKCIKKMAAPLVFAEREKPFCVEIGRYHGGSTTLLLAAGADVLSIDNHSKDKDSSRYDKKLIKWAKDNDKSLQVVVGDSGNYDAIKLEIDLILFDGRHSYEGVKQDFENFYGAIKYGGSIIFHDLNIPGVAKLVKEKEARFTEVKKVCSLLHVQKTKNPVNR